MVVFDNLSSSMELFKERFAKLSLCHHEIHFSKHLISPLPRKPHGITDLIGKYVKFNLAPCYK